MAVELLEQQITAAKISTSKPFVTKDTYIDPGLKELNRERNYARKIFQTTRNPVFKSKLNKINKMISKLSEKVQSEGLVNELRKLNADDGTIWKYVKPFKKKFKNIPNLISPAGIANTDQEKANFLADSLEKQFTLNNISDPDTEEIVSDSVTCFRINNNYPSELNDPPFPSEIVKCIKKLKINKAPGIDSIDNKMLKNLPWNIILNLNTIIHKIMAIGHFPSRWKTATVVPILKPANSLTAFCSHTLTPLSSANHYTEPSSHPLALRTQQLTDSSRQLACPHDWTQDLWRSVPDSYCHYSFTRHDVTLTSSFQSYVTEKDYDELKGLSLTFPD
ncbi:hypothetical protein AVEN_207328-1 [Araneus ventricosus]|uniref:RNA-directed DNA polymerase from mobile element jockey n=1 Tax=Araneus ventricosus TaxID=182803 RepID=A0A4Y2VF84_ARAVE|nr:hypothetical protein AVEN_46692-1 [Araneus ventricosus]GBO22397.1 hypothetical protein AVEN_61916-1 [Araneus ventricosus]GBO22402.1 hypothetical protein AVEN_109540-1 [Araneus ventricosus]GBO22403.1 hypothetical protein AVEN_207328-1 [Araneus ventricosus]